MRNEKLQRIPEPIFRSIFSNIHMPISKALVCLYLKALEIKDEEISKQIDFDRHYVSNFFNKVLEPVDGERYSSLYNKISGNGRIIEIDETRLISRRNNRGRILTGERYWVIGAIDRESKEIRLKLIRNRNMRICCEFIMENVEAETRIITDKWRSYNGLDSLGFVHDSIDHSVEFVNSEDNSIHTQTIERLWSSLKNNFPKLNSYELIEKHINRYVFKHNLKTASKKFQFYLNINKLS